MKKKIIRDLVHGYISLNETDISFIDTPIFQRLKRIRQTTAHAAYPNANHTRFEHSLGVMHLGVLIFNLLKEKVKSLGKKNIEKTVRYACLLHDIGQAPFSHALEDLYDEAKCKEELEKCDVSFDIDEVSSAPHEQMSCLVALKTFKNEFKTLKVDHDLFFRMILGIEYKKSKSESKLNPLIQLLNSNIDVDKLDYLLRDNVMTGVNMVSLDVDRIIQSYKIHKKELFLTPKALSVISNLVYGRNAMYMWVYNHHIVVYYTSLIRKYMEYLIDENPKLKEKYFSFDAINRDLVDDYDIIHLFKSERDYDDHTKNLFNQIFNRKYLKPLWKTKFEFENILDDHQQDEILLYAKGKLEEDLKKDLKLNEDDLYIVIAKYKPFNPSDSEHIYVLIKNKPCRFADLFQLNIHSKSIRELPYIFTKEEYKESVLEKLK